MTDVQSDPFNNLSSIRGTAGPPVDHEMNQNIKLGENPGEVSPNAVFDETQRTSDTDGLDSALGTLDEPVSETIVSQHSQIS